MMKRLLNRYAATAIVLCLGLVTLACAAPPARTFPQRAKDLLDAVKGEPVTNAQATRVVDAWCRLAPMPDFAGATNAQKAEFFIKDLKRVMIERVKASEAEIDAAAARAAAEQKVANELPLEDPA